MTKAEEILEKHLADYDTRSYTSEDRRLKQCYINAINEAINLSGSCKSDSGLLCECGGNERIALDCTIKPCKHPKYRNKQA